MTLEDDTRYDEAVAAYEHCLRIDTKNYQAATNIGEAFRKDEKYPAAISAYDRALELRPDYLYALAGRAECMRMLGDYQGIVPALSFDNPGYACWMSPMFSQSRSRNYRPKHPFN